MENFKEKINLENGKEAYLDQGKLFVKLNPSEKIEGIKKEILSTLNVKAVSIKESKESFLKLNATNEFFFLNVIKADTASLIEKLTSFSKFIDHVSPVYYSDEKQIESYFALVSNALVLQYGEEQDKQGLRKLIEKYNFKIDEVKSKYLSGSVYVKSDSINLDIYDLKTKIGRSWSLVSEVYTEKIPFIIPTCGLPNDPLYPNQWNLNQMQWHEDYNKCTNNVVVAVIDEGCELNHPDLNFSSPGINLNTMMPTGASTGNHGTACAGIAVGVTNNSQGISGVSGKSKLLPLAVVTWSTVEIANGINYAATYGADVISMSFGVYDSWNYWNYALIDAEIVYAHNLGVFMCAATGNENNLSLNRFPSKHPLVVSVGGSNREDVRKHVGDTSSESWWGACAGLELYQSSWVGVSVVAPCLEIPTTDILGVSGYSSGDYTNGFNGTSSATPQVAGLAALLKAHYPMMNAIDLRKIIEQSADKIGTYVYSHDIRFPNASWTQETGHGRINIRKALKLAESLFGCYSKSNNCC